MYYVGISAASGFITGAFGAKFPGAHRLAEGVVDTAVSAGERYLYAVFDDSMSREEICYEGDRNCTTDR